MKLARCLCLVAICGEVAGLHVARAHEEQEILVGRSAADAIKVMTGFEQPIELPESIFPGIPGHATGELAFHSTILDDTLADFFQLSLDADFQLVLLAKDAGMEIWNGQGYMQTNEIYAIGPAPFDTHPIWNIVGGAAGKNYSLTMKLQDRNGVYPDSEPFVLSFTPAFSEFQLNLTPVSAQQALITWPTNALGWQLEQTSSLSGPDWTVLTNLPVVAGKNFSLTVATTEAQQFFRLHKVD